MPTEAEVIQQIEALPNGPSYVSVAGPKELARIMDPDEHLYAVVDGYYGKEEECGLFFATEKRVIYIHKGVFWGVHVESFYYDHISSIQYETGFYYGNVTIYMDNHTARLKTVPGEDEEGFVEKVHQLMAVFREKQSPSSPESASSMLSALERLAALHASGALTDEEFTAAKRKLLDMDAQE